MFHEFKAFIMRGNVLDLAVGVIIGAGFGKIVTSLTDDIIMPIIGRMFGGLDFSDKYVVLSGSVAPGTPLADARKTGANLLAYGSFVSAVIAFVILAWIIFLIVKAANRALPPKVVVEVVAGPSEAELLAEIRDELRRRP
ncbi:MAG: large conductance mechanosensitive channel protein MscL [Croceibacterium sp.]